MIEKLSNSLQTALKDTDLRSHLENMGVSAVSTEKGKPESLKAHLKYEMETLGPLLIKAGVQAN